MRLARSVSTAACLVALAACTLKGGPGKLDVDPRWKETRVPHARSISPPTVRAVGYLLTVESAAVVEERTVFGPERWKVVVAAAVVNERPERLLLTRDLGGKLAFVFAGGRTLEAYVATRGSRGATGWKLQEHTQEPSHLLPGVRGLIEAWAPLDGKAVPDEPVALLVEGQRLEIRR